MYSASRLRSLESILHKVCDARYMFHKFVNTRRLPAPPHLQLDRETIVRDSLVRCYLICFLLYFLLHIKLCKLTFFVICPVSSEMYILRILNTISQNCTMMIGI